MNSRVKQLAIASLFGAMILATASAPAWPQGAVVAASGLSPMEPDKALVEDLVAANRILADKNILDAFGHVSARDPRDPNRYWLARSGAPGLVGPGDLLSFDLQSAPIDARGRAAPLERFIHGAIYKARPDVMAIIHTHAPATIPFGVTQAPLKPIYHMASFLSLGAPVFEIRATAGPATDLLITSQNLGDALAKSLESAAIVLMRGHGATVVGVSLPQSVFRAVYSVANAELQMQASAMGAVTYLTDAEAAAVTQVNNVALNKAWLLWKEQAARAPGARR